MGQEGILLPPMEGNPHKLHHAPPIYVSDGAPHKTLEHPESSTHTCTHIYKVESAAMLLATSHESDSCVCVWGGRWFLPFWETLDRSVMILLAFLLLEGAELVNGIARRCNKVSLCSDSRRMERSQKISLSVGLQRVIYSQSADANVLMWNQEVIRSDAVMVTASLCFPATVTVLFCAI